VLSRRGASKIAVRSLSASAAVGAALEDNRDIDKKAQRAGVDFCTNDRRRTFRLVSKKRGTKPDFEAFDGY
jgi:hypothetical protein